MTTTADLAKMMNVSEADCARFIAAIRPMVERGMSIEAAIVRSQKIAEAFANNAVRLSSDLRETAIDWFFPAQEAA